MGIGYTRNDGPNNIANGNVIDATDLDGEFDAIVDAFAEATGHTHDGTSAEGGAVTVVGPAQEFIGDGTSWYPKTDATYDLGKVSSSFNVAYVETLNLGGTAITATAAEINYTDGVTSAIQTQLDDKQPLDAGLTSISGLTTLADRMIYTTASDTYAVATLTAAGRSLIDDASASDQRTTLGLGTAATTDSTAYATAAQGTTADAALPKAGGTMTGDLSFGDNDKAIFGAGLQIYDNGTDSHILGTNTGHLVIEGSDLRLRAVDNTNYFRGVDGSATYLYHPDATNGIKLATTSTGVDVTGTITSDGLTVDTDTLHVDATNNRVGIGTSSPEATLTVDGQTIIGDGVAGSANLTNLTSGTPPQLIAGFSVPAITWSPSASTEAVFTRDGAMQIDILAGANNFSNINFSDPDDEDVGQLSYDHSTDAMRFRTDNSERMRIDSNGNVGIGTSSPEEKLHVEGNLKVDFGSAGGNPRVYLDHDSATDDGNYLQLNRGDDGLEVVGQDNVKLRTNGAERMRIDSSGNVGLGTITPAHPLDVTGAIRSDVSTTGDFNFIATSTGGGSFRISPDDATTANPTWRYQTNSSEGHAWVIGGAERMRLDSSGNVLVGKTSPSISVVGVEMRGSSGTLRATSQDAIACYFTRKGTAGGSIINFYKDDLVAGVIGASSDGDLYIGEDSVGLQFQNTGSDRIDPYDVDGNTVRDNAIDLGGSSSRFDDVYVTGGLIQTSDRNEKQDIASLTPTEMLVAARLSTGFKNFRWKDSVAEKGSAARVHSGVIAQDVQDAFTAEGLEAGDYSMFISATWWTHDVDVPAVEAVAEVVDEEGVVVTEAVEAVAAYTRTDTYDTEAEAPVGAVSKTRLGVRYPELLSFVAAYNEQRFASIEARLTALEAV